MSHRLRPRVVLATEFLEARANPASFSTLTDYWAGSNVMSVAVGDVNGDGHNDFVAGSAVGGVEIFINDGTGLFSQTGAVSIGSPCSLKLADLDADGNLDIVVANQDAAVGGEDLVTARGNGDGTFQAPVFRSVGRAAQDVVTTDVNGDGKLDALVATGNGAAVFLNDGSADIFGTPTFYDNLSQGDGTAVAAGDFNGDGAADFAINAVYANRTDVYLNNGDGTFGSPTTIANPVSSQTRGIVAGDFDNDGNLDLVVAYGYSPTVGLLRGNGDGTFQNPELFDTPVEWTGSLATGDFDRDGNLDLLIHPMTNANQAVLIGDGMGGFSSSHVTIYAPSLGGVGIGDVNDDGLPDIITGHGTSPGLVSVSINTGDFRVLSSFTVTAPTQATVGEPFTITATALDQFGHTLDNYTGTIHFTSTDSLAGLPADYQFTLGDNGTATFTVTLNSVGSWTVTAADTFASAEGTGGPIETSLPVEALSSFTVTAPEFVTVGESFTITVTAINQFGAPLISYTGTVHFTSTDGLAGRPADYTFVVSDNGTATFTVTLYSVGNWTITATDIDTLIAGTSDSIAALPEAPGSLIDRGQRGLWLSAGGEQVKISNMNAQSAVMAAHGETVVADFGRRGLWCWSADGWDQLARANVEKVKLSADGESVVADFGAGGLRRWSDTDGWDKLTWANAQSYSISADGTTVVADFGYLGLWRWTESANWWTRITRANVERVALAPDGSAVVADFGGGVVRKWSAATKEWVPQALPHARYGAPAAAENGSLLKWLDNEGIWVG